MIRWNKCIRVREDWQNKYCFLLYNFSKQMVFVCLFTCRVVFVFQFSKIVVSPSSVFAVSIEWKGKFNEKWIENRHRGLVSCAAAPCGKCFQLGLPKSAICPHDGPAALGRMHPGRFEKEKIFGKLYPDSHPNKQQYWFLMAISIHCTLIFKGLSVRVF